MVTKEIKITKKNLEEKQEHKKMEKTKLFRVSNIMPLIKNSNSDYFLESAKAMCELGFQVSVLAEGDQESQKKCFLLLEEYPQNFHIFESDSKNRENVLKNSDVVIFSACPEKKYLNDILVKNIVPIIPENCGITDFCAQKEIGEGFVFEQGNFWQMMSAIIRASENFKFSYDWRLVKKNLAKF